MSQYLKHEKMAYCIEEASDLLSLSRAQVYRLIDLGELGTIKIGKARRITSAQLDAFLTACEQQSGFIIDQLASQSLARTRRTST